MLLVPCTLQQQIRSHSVWHTSEPTYFPTYSICCHCWFSSATISQYYCSQYYLDNTLSLNKHTTFICQSMYFHMTAVRHVCPALTDDIATALTVTFVQSRLVYANSILFKTSTTNINKIQRAQNTLHHHHLICQIKRTMQHK